MPESEFIDLGKYPCPKDGRKIPATEEGFYHCEKCEHHIFWWPWQFPEIGKHFPPHDDLEITDEIIDYFEWLSLYKSWYMTCSKGWFGVPYVTKEDMKKVRAPVK